MADKQGLLKKNSSDGFFADGDPLAELARLVNFDPSAESRPRSINQRREPEFNLEDELLKEFEQYEAPAVEPDFRHSAFAPNSVEQVSPEPQLPEEDAAPATDADYAVLDREGHLPEPELDIASALEYEVAPELYRETAEDTVIPEARQTDAFASEQAMDVSPAERPHVTAGRVEPLFAGIEATPAVQPSHPVFDLEDEIMREFSAFDERRRGSGEKIDHSPVHNDIEDRSVAIAQEDMAAFAPADPVSVHEDEFAGDVEFSEEELLSAVMAEDEQVEASDPIAEIAEEPVHFEADRQSERDWYETYFPSMEPVAEAAPVASVAEEPVQIAAIEPPPSAPVFSEVVVPEAPRSRQPDPLLAQVEHYPIEPAAQTKWSRQTSFGTKSVHSHPGEPAASAPEIPQPMAQTLEEQPAEVVEPVVSEVETKAEEEISAPDDMFDDSAFELDLSELELDLIEMQAEGEIAGIEDTTEARISASDSVLSAHEPKQAEPREESVPVVLPVVADYASLPFDPTQVVTEEEPLEAIADLDVPDVPKPEKEPLPAQHTDYDIDIDADIADLFAKTPPAAEAKSAAARATPAPSLAQTVPVSDDFEKALEEDFRRSLTENRETFHPDRMAITPEAYEESKRERSAVNRRILVLAASVAGLLLVGGVGVYAYMGGRGTALVASSGEPKVILADKDPIKVAPENPGGQTVPNQDKAVYERVSGEDNAAEKQNRLVSSNEEPVDVVQKTLLPENLPMDDEGDGASNPAGTPTQDTTDTRLLPDGTQAQNVTTAEKVVNGVAPRKVRTMVVRPDGSLVARDETTDAGTATADGSAADASSQDQQSASADVPERLPAVDAATAKATGESSQNDAIAAAIATNDQPADANTQEDATQPAAGQQDNSIQSTAGSFDIPATDDATQPVADAAIKTGSDGQANTVQAADNNALAAAAEANVETPAQADDNVGQADASKAPIPQSRPDRNQNTDTARQNTADANPQVASAEIPAPEQTSQPAAAGGYVIQIASLPSEAEAQASYNKLSVKFANVIGGHGVDIRKADIKNKGTYYRVRIPAGSKQEAADMCARYKAAGGSCLVSR